MRAGAFAFAVSAVVIVAVWWWLGRPVAMPAAPLAAGEKLDCISYAPFRGLQTPLDLSTHIDQAQIEDDLARLAPLTRCVRTYSTHLGLDQVADIARKNGLKVMQGLWLGRDRAFNRNQIESAIALANRYPDVIQAVVVGNEVLLRGELSPADLAAVIREVKSRVPVPVTYADVWEFWLRNPELAAAVDVVTIHILPYWEDEPVSAALAARHVSDIRRKVVEAFPGKDVMIGEVGWPSVGRMREGALPSPSNQARVIQEVIANSKAENARLNVIEAFDQPWKRGFEGTVGGHWGLFDGASRLPKFRWGEPVSDHPQWIWQAAGGVAFAALVTLAAIFMMPPPLARNASSWRWIGVAINAAAGGIFLGWAVANAPLESLGIGGWLRSGAWLLAAFLAGPVATMTLVRSHGLPAFAEVLGPRAGHPPARAALAAGLLLAAVTVLAIQAALGLVFDPRYQDFPFAPMTAAIVPFAVLAISGMRLSGVVQFAETVAAAILIGSAIYIAPNEGLANWQAIWVVIMLVLLAAILIAPRAARS